MTISRIPSVEGGIQPTLLTAKGDLISATAASTVARLAVGSDSQILVADSSTATGLKWATPAGGGGKVLQVVYGSTTTETTNSTSTMADTALTATITPSSATSKILVMVTQQNIEKNSGNVGNGFYGEIRRDSTTITNFGGSLGYNNANAVNRFSSAMNYLDEPATTSAVVYKTRFRSAVNGQTTTVQIDGYRSTIILLEIGA